MDVDPIVFPLVTARTDGKRRKRDVQPAERQLKTEGLEVAADGRGPESHAEDDASRVAEEEDGAPSTMGSAYNPENPYHVCERHTSLTALFRMNKNSERGNLLLTIKRRAR